MMPYIARVGMAKENPVEMQEADKVTVKMVVAPKCRYSPTYYMSIICGDSHVEYNGDVAQLPSLLTVGLAGHLE
jgi:hypothetical protein